MRGSSRGGYVRELDWLNTLATLQGVASVLLVVSWITLILVGILRKRRLNREATGS